MESRREKQLTLASDGSDGEAQCAKEHDHVDGKRSSAAWT